MNQEQYGQAYQDGFRSTVRLLRFRGASLHAAEDVAQSAWLQGWCKLDQLRDESTLMGWINTIAVNYYRRGGKRDARYQPLPELCGGHVEMNSAAIDTARILKICRPRDRSLFEQQLGGLTTEEIATARGVSQTAIRIRFLRARRDARANLEDRARALRTAFQVREHPAVTVQ